MAGLTTVTATIPAGQSMSNSVDCTAGSTSGEMRGLIMPDAWIVAGGITFQVSMDNINWHNVYIQTGDEFRCAVTPGALVYLFADFARTVKFLRIRSGTSGQPYNQPVARDFQVILMT